MEPPLPLPEPGLIDQEAGVALRPWRAADAPVLAAAWAVADIADQATVPGEATVDAATRWIEGAATRRELGLSVDLVVAPLGGEEVWGEAGVARWRPSSEGRSRDELEVGWWVLPDHRGRGVAGAAARLVVDWVLTGLGASRVVARIERGAVASEAVAAHAGLDRLGPLDATRDLWVGRRPGFGTALPPPGGAEV